MQSVSNAMPQNSYAMQVGGNVSSKDCPRIEPSVSSLVVRLLKMVEEAEARSRSASDIAERLNGSGAVGCNNSPAEPQASGVLSEFEYALRRLSDSLVASGDALEEISRKIG